MAQGIAVEGSTAFLKKHEARRLINRGWAVWAIEGKSIRRLTTRATPEFHRDLGYIPDKLPLAELPGIIFEPPASAQPQFAEQVFPDLPHLPQ